MHFAKLISFQDGRFPLSRCCVSSCLSVELTSGVEWVFGVLLHPAVVFQPTPTLLWGVLCDKVVSCVFCTRKGIVTKANSDTWYSYVQARAREKLHWRDSGQLLEVVAMQKLHSVPLATHVSGFVLMLESDLSENSEQLHWKNIVIK